MFSHSLQLPNLLRNVSTIWLAMLRLGGCGAYVRRRKTFRCSGECASFARLDVYIRSRNKMALGYVYTLGKQSSSSPERCTSRNATSAEFLEIQIPPHVLVYG